MIKLIVLSKEDDLAEDTQISNDVKMNEVTNALWALEKIKQKLLSLEFEAEEI